MQISHKRAFIISSLFNVYWLLCILGQNQALLMLLAFYAAVLIYDKSTALPSLGIALIGVVVDISLTLIGFFEFDAEQLIGPFSITGPVPLWLYMLWLGFASYAWLMRSYVFKYQGFALVAVTSFAGASSYFAAQKFGAVALPFNLFLTLGLLAFLWGVYGWLFAGLYQFFSQNVLLEPEVVEQSIT